jgi:hypothetical protein
LFLYKYIYVSLSLFTVLTSVRSTLCWDFVYTPLKYFTCCTTTTTNIFTFCAQTQTPFHFFFSHFNTSYICSCLNLPSGALYTSPNSYSLDTYIHKVLSLYYPYNNIFFCPRAGDQIRTGAYSLEDCCATIKHYTSNVIWERRQPYYKYCYADLLLLAQILPFLSLCVIKTKTISKFCTIRTVILHLGHTFVFNFTYLHVGHLSRPYLALLLHHFHFVHCGHLHPHGFSKVPPRQLHLFNSVSLLVITFFLYLITFSKVVPVYTTTVALSRCYLSYSFNLKVNPQLIHTLAVAITTA